MAFQRTGRPRRQFGHDLFRTDGNQLRRHVRFVDVIQVAVDGLGRKPSGLKGDDLLVEIRQAALRLLNNDRIESPVTVARPLDRDFAAVRLQRLGALSIAAVGGIGGRVVMGFLAEMRRHLGRQPPLHQGPFQGLQAALDRRPVASQGIVGQNVIQQFIGKKRGILGL